VAKPYGHIITDIKNYEGREACMPKLPQECVWLSKGLNRKGCLCFVVLKTFSHIYE